MTDKIDVIDLFCGAGGMSVGFQTFDKGRAFRVLGGVDFDHYACETFTSQLGAPALEADLRSWVSKRGRDRGLAKLLRRGPGPLVVVGGPPCQGFSAHRKKDPRSDKRNDLVQTFFEVAIALEPEFIVMENVPELFDDKHWASTSATLSFLESSGYRARARIHGLAEYGVPQARYRALIIARRAGRFFNFPTASHREALTVRDAIAHLPNLRAGQADPSDPMHVAPNHTTRILQLIRSVPRDGGSRNQARLDLLPDCHAEVDGFRDVYGRLAWDRPAISITAKSSTPSCGRFLHPEQHRNISVREAALLQGFPADFQFSGPLVQRYRQVGNAVSPLFSKAIARQISSDIAKPSNVIEEAERDITSAQGRSFTSSIAHRKKRGNASKRRSSSHAPIQRTAVDLFAGAGGISLGLRQAGYKILYAMDHDPDAVRTYRYNLGDHIELADATSLSGPELLRRIGLRKGELDLLAGGPPCQGFSQQGRGQADDPRNELVRWYAEAISSLLPRSFLFENVPYVASKRGRPLLEEFLKITRSAGYKVTHTTINAADYGVAQNRFRFVAVGVLNGHLPKLAGSHPAEKRVTIRDVIGRLPAVPDVSAGEHPNFANHTGTSISAINKLRISHVPPGGGWQDIPDELQLPCHRKHRGHGHVDVFGRLRWDDVASTITAHSDSFSRGRYAHPSEDRPLTGRELAALQGFPHWFRFVADKKSVARLVGNAVPPPVAAHLGRAVAQVLDRDHIDSVPLFLDAA